MGYYIRVLGKKSDNVPLESLRDRARPAVLKVSQGTEDDWREAILSHASGQESMKQSGWPVTKEPGLYYSRILVRKKYASTAQHSLVWDITRCPHYLATSLTLTAYAA